MLSGNVAIVLVLILINGIKLRNIYNLKVENIKVHEIP